MQAASAKSRIRPRSMPAPPLPMALQFSRQRLCLEVFPTHLLTQEECSWTGSTARRHTSSPIKPKAVVVGSGQKKSGSETQIALIRQQETSSGGSKGDAKEWPLSGRASKSQYFDKIKVDLPRSWFDFCFKSVLFCRGSLPTSRKLNEAFF